MKEKIPTSKEVDPLAEIDRNSRKLEMILGNTPVLTIGDLRKFLPCSISLDPYLRKLIKGDNTLLNPHTIVLTAIRPNAEATFVQSIKMKRFL